MHKNWLITHNNPKVNLQDYLEAWAKPADYVNGQLEKGTEGTVHIQAYISLPRSQRLSWLKKRDPQGHFSPVKRDNGASSYCLKEETRIEGPLEYGTKPVNRSSRTDWDKIRDLAKSGKLEDIPADIYVRCYN